MDAFWKRTFPVSRRSVSPHGDRPELRLPWLGQGRKLGAKKPFPRILVDLPTGDFVDKGSQLPRQFVSPGGLEGLLHVDGFKPRRAATRAGGEGAEGLHHLVRFQRRGRRGVTRAHAREGVGHGSCGV